MKIVRQKKMRLTKEIVGICKLVSIPASPLHVGSVIAQTSDIQAADLGAMIDVMLGFDYDVEIIVMEVCADIHRLNCLQHGKEVELSSSGFGVNYGS